MKRFPYAVVLTAFLVGLACCHVLANGSESASVHASENLSAAISSEGPATVAAPISDEEEKLTIKKIMKLAHKSGLLKKVATGKATDEETAELHKYYLAMPELTPPKGDAESWETKTTELIKASQAAVDKDPNASAMLKSATDCAACHKVHK